MSLTTRIAGLKAMMRFDNKFQIVINRLCFKSNIDIYHYKNCRILVDHEGGDATGVRECLSSDMYRCFLPAMKLEKTLSVLDCGANGGGFPLLLHTEGYDLGKVVSIEMNPYTYSRLQFNLINNLSASIHCLNMIIEDKSGERRFTFGKGSTGDSLLNPATQGTEFTISSIDVNSLISNYFGNSSIDIAKIDIEGAEYAVFHGNNHNLLKHCRYILIEIHSVREYSRDEIIEKIRHLNFKLLQQDQDVYLFSNCAYQ